MRRYYTPPPAPTQYRTVLTWRARLSPDPNRTWPWWASSDWDYHLAEVRMLPVLRHHGLTVTWRDYARAYLDLARDVAWSTALCAVLVFLGCALVWSL